MSEVSFDECCADSPYPFIKDPNLVSSKLVKKYLQEGGNIDEDRSFLKDNWLVITLILGLILFLVYLYFKKKEDFQNKKNNNIKIPKIKNNKKSNKNLPTLMKNKKKDFKPINSN